MVRVQYVARETATGVGIPSVVTDLLADVCVWTGTFINICTEEAHDNGEGLEDWPLPMQEYPLGASVAPGLQVQVKEPMVLWQTWSQLCVPSKHSSISAVINST